MTGEPRLGFTQFQGTPVHCGMRVLTHSMLRSQRGRIPVSLACVEFDSADTMRGIGITRGLMCSMIRKLLASIGHPLINSVGAQPGGRKSFRPLVSMLTQEGSSAHNSVLQAAWCGVPDVAVTNDVRYSDHALLRSVCRVTS